MEKILQLSQFKRTFSVGNHCGTYFGDIIKKLKDSPVKFFGLYEVDEYEEDVNDATKIALVNNFDEILSLDLTKNDDNFDLDINYINENEGFIVDCTKSNFTYGTDEALQLLSMPKRPNAIIASDDALAVGALKACYIKKLTVPKEIVVVGWDNIPLSEFVYPSITTVAHDYTSLARKAVDIIIDKKQRPSTDCIYTYPMTIINRGSCNLNEL